MLEYRLKNLDLAREVAFTSMGVGKPTPVRFGFFDN